MSRKLSALIAVTALIAGCSSDIVVKSDVGEISTVKETSVSSYVFDKENAISENKIWLKKWAGKLEDCVTTEIYLTRKDCERIWSGEQVKRWEGQLITIETMPDIKVVEYRTIDTNVNGDKTASGYKYVACIPEGSVDDQLKWFQIVKEIDGVNAEPKKEIKSNLLDDGKVVSSVRIEVCDKYGDT